MPSSKTRGRNVLFRLYILGQLTNELFDSAMTRRKLNPNDFAVQSAIRAYQPVTPSRLSALLGTPPTTLSSQLARLERRKQIKRRRNPEDGRSSLIELTKAGERNVLAAMPALRGAIALVSEHLDYSLEELDLALDRLEDAMRVVLSRPDESMRRPGRRARRRAR
jgi:MarR family transcriptional regulator, organic hydroperoxide resistance regulator